MKTARLAMFATSVVASLMAMAAASENPTGFSPNPPAEGVQIKTDHGYMIPYTATIPGSKVKFEMMPIPPGKFKIGSPPTEAGRADDEGPQVEIQIDAFWVGKCEITWGEYKEFMKMYDLFKSFEGGGVRKLNTANEADAVTAPSNLYEPETTFTYGENPEMPAVTMSQHAAKQYTKWLSKLTSQIYRLPTEAEWEYACRADAKTAFSFGDDPQQLEQFGWFFDNSNDTPHKVGLKRANAWGLHDMHGNVSEWVLDEYTQDGYQRLTGKSIGVSNAVAWPTKLYPRVLRGGCWYDDAAAVRCAARQQSKDDDWRATDPNRPVSPWWFTEDDSMSVGFRIIRPLAPPSQEILQRAWEADVESMRRDEAARIQQGRGVRGLVDPNLPVDNVKQPAASNQ